MGRKKYDFSGWATRCNIKCSDGRTIKPGAFADNDGETVPLVWMHMHNDPENVLGHAELENRDDGVYAYCTFNDTDKAKVAKELVRHGDVAALSIYANQLKQKGGDVLHGSIREVSLVLAGANKGAYITNVGLMHGDDEESDEAIVYSLFDDSALDVDGEDTIAHSDDEGEEEENSNMDEERSVADVYDDMDEEQQAAVAFLIGQAVENAEDEMADGDYDYEDYDYEDDGDYDDMVEHDVFEGDDYGNSLMHGDGMGISFDDLYSDAKALGSWQSAVKNAEDNGVIEHADLDMTGMTGATGTQTYGFNDPDMLFPEFHELNNTPEWIKRPTEWVSVVMNGTKHSPFSRIKTTFANITNDEARARGYIKGKMKKEEVFSLLKRTVTPTTVYKKQKMDKDDITDITGFDVIAWLKGEMRIMLDEELARAFLVGDGRLASDEDKIREDCIKPIATDVPLFNIKRTAKSNDVSEIAKTFVDDVVIAMEDYQGSGKIKAFIRKDLLTRLTLLKDGQGYRLYKTRQELATAMQSDSIVSMPKEIMGNHLAIFVDLTDYTVGADKGGSVNLFDDFDIDYNQKKYLIETRCSGMLTKPYSAVTFDAPTAAASTGE